MAGLHVLIEEGPYVIAAEAIAPFDEDRLDIFPSRMEGECAKPSSETATQKQDTPLHGAYRVASRRGQIEGWAW